VLFDDNAKPAIREFPWLKSGPIVLSFYVEEEYL
jgi:hypothetical protein